MSETTNTEDLKPYTLVLATGELIQADTGVSTHHHSDKLGRVVPVVQIFENGAH